MVQAISYTDVAHTRRLRSEETTDGVSTWNTRYLGARAREVLDEPQAFRVDMPPGRVTKAHFHVVDQYQVFVAGAGKLGRENAPTICVHYADHHTAYGPIIAGERGFAYFTLRPQVDTGPVYLDRPDFREQLRPSKKRHHTITDVTLAIDPVMQAREETLLEPLFAPEADGLAGYMLRAGAGKDVTCPDPAGSGGHYIFVVQGDFLIDGKSCPAQSMVWVDPTDKPVSVTAGKSGFEALVLQFPARPN